MLRVRDTGPGNPAGAARVDLHRGLVHEEAAGARQARHRALPGAQARRTAGWQRDGRRGGRRGRGVHRRPARGAGRAGPGTGPDRAVRCRRPSPRRSRDDRGPGRGRRHPGRAGQRRVRREGARLPGGRRRRTAPPRRCAAVERCPAGPGPAGPLPARRDGSGGRPGDAPARPPDRRDHGDGGPATWRPSRRRCGTARCSTWSSRSPSRGCAPSWRRTRRCAAPWTAAARPEQAEVDRIFGALSAPSRAPDLPKGHSPTTAELVRRS